MILRKETEFEFLNFAFTIPKGVDIKGEINEGLCLTVQTPNEPWDVQICTLSRPYKIEEVFKDVEEQFTIISEREEVKHGNLNGCMIGYESERYCYCEYQFEINGDERNRILAIILEIPREKKDKIGTMPILTMVQAVTSLRKIEE